MIQDSGKRREFSTGAVRDISEGKGRCDLLPLSIVSDLMDITEFHGIERFKETKDVDHIYGVLNYFIKNVLKTDPATAILEVSKHYEEGAGKYGENNWKKGLPLHCYLDSAVRHRLRYARGDGDERHDRAYIWNLLGAAWTYKNLPYLDDVEKDIEDSKFDYIYGSDGTVIKTRKEKYYDENTGLPR